MSDKPDFSKVRLMPAAPRKGKGTKLKVPIITHFDPVKLDDPLSPFGLAMATMPRYSKADMAEWVEEHRDAIELALQLTEIMHQKAEAEGVG